MQVTSSRWRVWKPCRRDIKWGLLFAKINNPLCYITICWEKVNTINGGTASVPINYSGVTSIYFGSIDRRCYERICPPIWPSIMWWRCRSRRGWKGVWCSSLWGKTSIKVPWSIRCRVGAIDIYFAIIKSIPIRGVAVSRVLYIVYFVDVFCD